MDGAPLSVKIAFSLMADRRNGHYVVRADFKQRHVAGAPERNHELAQKRIRPRLAASEREPPQQLQSALNGVQSLFGHLPAAAGAGQFALEDEIEKLLQILLRRARQADSIDAQRLPAECASAPRARLSLSRSRATHSSAVT